MFYKKKYSFRNPRNFESIFIPRTRLKTLRIEAWLEFNEINRIETRGNVFARGSTAKLKALQKAWYAINDAVIIDV